MELHSEAEDRALDAQCASPRSIPSRIAMTKLKAMSLEDKARYLASYTMDDLGNLVRCALAAGISADTRWGDNNAPVLCIAAGRANMRALKELLAGGVNHTLADERGWTAAHRAAFYGQAACLRLLLDAGAQVEVETCDGSSPLHLAAQEGRINRS